MTRRLSRPAAVLALLALLLAQPASAGANAVPGPAPISHAGPLRPLATSKPPGGHDFTVDCSAGIGSEGFRLDDPILAPGDPGGADHLHMFFGNLAVNADTTNNELVHGTSACENGGTDHSGYWIPRCTSWTRRRCNR